MNELPDFSPYEVPLDLPITGSMSCDLCHMRSVEFIAHMSFRAGVSDWVGFGCGPCVTRWRVGAVRAVTYSGKTPTEVRLRLQKKVEQNMSKFLKEQEERMGDGRA